MPRSRRRRVNDRRRESEQRLAARRTFEEIRLQNSQKTERYVRAVLRPKAGEVMQTHDGRKYQIQDDGSLHRVDNAAELVKEG